MADESSVVITSGRPARRLPTGTFAYSVTHDISAMSAADVLTALPVQSGQVVVDVMVSGTATDTVQVGDGDDPDRFITSAALTAGGVRRLDKHVGHCHQYAADDTIDVTVGGAGGTGTITLTVVLSDEPVVA